MSTLVESGTKAGLLTYATTKGTNVHLSARHIDSYTELPNHNILITTTGGTQRLAFENSTDCDAAKVILDGALAD